MKKKSSVKYVRKLKKVLSVSVFLLMVLVISSVVITYFVEKTVVDGNSMAPNLKDGDVILLNKSAYRNSDPQRFDVIVFPYQYDKNHYVIKRIIGMPGEAVRITSDGKIFINGKELSDKYYDGADIDPGLAEDTCYLLEDEYFVLGDNRADSIDSRYDEIGFIRRRNIVGKAFFRLFPLSEIKVF